MSNETNDPKAPYGGTSSADACYNGHTFIYAGANYKMPEGWPCQCGKIRWKKHEELIASSDLIRKDELVAWLESQVVNEHESDGFYCVLEYLNRLKP